MCYSCVTWASGTKGKLLHHSGPETVPLSVCFPDNHLPSSACPFPTLGLRRKGNGCKLLSRENSAGKFHESQGWFCLPRQRQGRGCWYGQEGGPRDVVPPPFSCLYLKSWCPFVCACVCVFKHTSHWGLRGDFQTLRGGLWHVWHCILGLSWVSLAHGALKCLLNKW